MIGLDTNVLVRYFAQDDAAQSKKATALMESFSAERPGYVSQIALVEVARVLARSYGVERGQRTISQTRRQLMIAGGLTSARNQGCPQETDFFVR